MSVWRRFEGHGYPSLVTTNVAERRPIFRSPDAAATLLETIAGVRPQEGIDLLAWVIMPDHLHLVLQLPPGVRLGRVMQLIKGRFAHRYNRSRLGAGPVWQSRYHERGLRSGEELVAAIHYVHYNPVVAGLAREPEAYVWSSAAAAAPRPDLSG
ncbi:MAG: transposase [Dehalococcoidia bacterium]|nr:transposase [Dehalococcoidia bacterium]